MGKIVSKLKSRNSVNEDEREIQKYAEETENRPYEFGLQNTDDLKKITWYQRLIFDLRFRIAYAIIIAIILGIGVPIAIHQLLYDHEDSTIYGSCLIKTEARFQCLINNAEIANRRQCVDANCCWEENDELPFKCYHSFPTADQYRVLEIKQLSENGDAVQITADPNQGWMTRLTILISWLDEGHLNLQMFNPALYPERVTSGLGDVLPGGPRSIEKDGLIISYPDVGDYFFIQIERVGDGWNRNETIFDTRLGPINSGNGFMAFTTTLSTPYFYGLTGGEGIASKSTVTFGVMNGFENAETPFYMSLENSNSWHGILLETTLPFVTQVLQAPGIGFHIEGPKADINLHFFNGPTTTGVLTQLHSYLSTRIGNETTSTPEIAPLVPYIPPYWGLGLHLCRSMWDTALVWEHIDELNNATLNKIPYDSDCIHGNLRNLLVKNSTIFSSEELADIVEMLNVTEKKIVLSQTFTIPFVEGVTDISEIGEFLVMNRMNGSSHPFVGMIDNGTVVYPDVFHPTIFSDLAPWNFNFSDIPVSGFILTDNFPRNENSSSCQKPGSFLQKLLLSTNRSIQIEPNDALKKINPWGSICPQISHTVVQINTSRVEKTHLELHNSYGLQSSKKIRQVLHSLEGDALSKRDLVLSTSSSWTESLYYGATNGMQANFTWVALRESLAHVVRHFVLSPVTGTTICGAFLPNEKPDFDNNLCLRWYQLGLLLPHAYHNYAKGNDSRGPLDFPKRYQNYLSEAIRQRYTYAPYYYTLLINYQKTFVPMILPMSYLFHNVSGVERATVFKLVDQFMIGEAILAAPIVKPELNRESYFPPGIWYDADGFMAWNDTGNGGFKTVTGYLVQTPLFLRGGYVIPTLKSKHQNLSELSVG
ncbi:Maltase-glucoamylase, intestinal [Folsomia candida]|uniref:Maltase-glucoamylase, intestinal n=1 Tax=Folsomia candida TaxID=158441 RepID=A0A226EGM2_FOLCA|nr:Maltase-glucoamylase, intestinal [Folsomia candida]